MKHTISRLFLRSIFVLICFSSMLVQTRAQDKSAFTANWPEWRGL